MNGLGSIIVFLKADASIYNRVLDHAARTMDRTAAGISGRVGRMITDISQRMTALGRVLTYTLSSALLVFAGTGVKAFSDFDDAINRTLAISEDASDTVKRHMEVNALAISRNGRQSAIDLANGYYYLVAAGLSAKESLEALGTVERFATAGAFSLEDASSLLVDTQNVLGLRVQDTTQNLINMNKVADVIAKAGNITNASTEQFARALVTKSGAALRLLGKDMEEGLAVLSALAQQGTKGELAGEQLYIFLRDTQAAALKNAEAWKTLGVSVYDASGDMMHVADIVGGLERLLNGASDAQVKATMKLLGFTDRSVGATYSLLGLSDAIREYEKQFRSANGDNVRIAAKRLESFAAGMIRFKNIIMGVAIDMARIFAPAMTAMADRFAEVMQWWDALNDDGKRVVVVIGSILASIGPVLLVLGSLGMTLGIIVTGIGGLITSMGPVIAGMVALGGGAAAVVAVFKGREGLMAAFDKGLAAAKRFAIMGIGFMTHFQANSKLAIEWFRNNVGNMWLDLQNLGKVAMQNVIYNIQVMGVGMMKIMAATEGWFSSFFVRVFSVAVAKAVAAGVRQSMAIWSAFWDWVAVSAASLGRATPELEAAANALGGQLTMAMNAGAQNMDLGDTLLDIVKETFGKMRGVLTGFSSSLEALPEFDYAMKLEELAKLEDTVTNALTTAGKAHNDLLDDMEEPIKMSIKVEGLDGVRKGGQAAELIWRQFERGRARMDAALDLRNVEADMRLIEAHEAAAFMPDPNAQGAPVFDIPLPDFNPQPAGAGLDPLAGLELNPIDIAGDPMDALEGAVANQWQREMDALLDMGGDDDAFLDGMQNQDQWLREMDNALGVQAGEDPFAQWMADNAARERAAAPRPVMPAQPRAEVPAQKKAEKEKAFWQEGGMLDKWGAGIAKGFKDAFKPQDFMEKQDRRPIVVVEPANLE